MTIKFTKDTMYLISLFENITKARIKDCFDENEKIYFVVEPGEIGKALGKNASNVKILQDKLNRKIKIVEFNPETIGFIKNNIYPIKAKNIEEQDEKIIITPPDSQSRGLLIGKNAKNLRDLEKVVQRYFPIKEIKVTQQNG